MAPELLRVSRIDEWPPARPGGVTVWIIKGETVEQHPRSVTVKTVDTWKAALLERLHKGERLAWVTWRDSFKGDTWLQTVQADDSKFTHQEAS